MKETGALISVIIPVYNVEHYLVQCLESVVCQTYQNMEIILIDDGSTDSSGSLCDQWAEKDGRIKVVHKENEGLSSARNDGLRVATGEYVAWVDSDDYISADFLEKLYKLLTNHNADMSMCNYYGVYCDEITFDGKTRIPDEEFTGKQFMEAAYQTGFFMPAWNKLAKRKAYHNVIYPVGKHFEDSAVLRKLVMNCKKIVTTNEPLYYYRRRKNSILSSLDSVELAEKYLEDYCAWLLDDIAVYREQGEDVLEAAASKLLCNTIIRRFAELPLEARKIYKAIYDDYVKIVLKADNTAFKAKMKYFIAKNNMMLYIRLFVHKKNLNRKLGE